MKKQLKTNLFIILFIASFLVAFPFVIKAVGQKDTAEPSVSSQVTTARSQSETVSQPKTTETTAVTTESGVYTTVAPSYFDDALFIGDSRTVGLSEYSGLTNADYFASVGMSLYKIEKETVSVRSVGKMKLPDLLKAKKYGKIYVMLGINDLGYDLQKTIGRYQTLLQEIKTLQPDAILYVCANLHVTKMRSESDDVFTNANIDKFNDALKTLAQQQNAYYIDINTVFDDGNGNLKDAYTSDNTHVLGRYYKEWGNWLCTQAVVK